MIHIPTLRAGKPYYSLKRQPLTDIRTGERLGQVSQTLPGMIARGLGGIINVSLEMEPGGYDEDAAVARIRNIFEALQSIFAPARGEGRSKRLAEQAAAAALLEALGQAGVGRGR